MGVPLGLGQLVQLLQVHRLAAGPVQPVGQSLPAVGQGGEVLLLQLPQAGEHTSFIVPQRRGVVHGQFAPMDLLPEVGCGGVVRVVSPIVARPHPGDGHHLGGEVQPPGGPEVLHPQVVVGAGQAGRPRLPQQLRQGQVAAPGEGQPPVQVAPQDLAVRPAVQGGRRPGQGGGVPRLTAEGEGIHLQLPQDGHRATCKGLRRGGGPHRWKLHYQVRPPVQGGGGPTPLVGNSAIPPLDEVAAHHCRHSARPQGAAGLVDLMPVPGMKGVVLRHDPHCPHVRPFLSPAVLAGTGNFQINGEIPLVLSEKIV